MKKLLLMGVALSAALTTFSADQFYVIMKDGSVESYPSDKVDSISFDDPQIAKIMGFNDMAAEIVKLKERVEALEAKFQTPSDNISLVEGEEYSVSALNSNLTFTFKVASVEGHYITKDQVVNLLINYKGERTEVKLSDAENSFLMWTETDGFKVVNLITARENAKDVVLYLSCANSTADYTINSPTLNESLNARGAVETFFEKMR